jgi:hypothetical protein
MVGYCPGGWAWGRIIWSGNAREWAPGVSVEPNNGRVLPGGWAGNGRVIPGGWAGNGLVMPGGGGGRVIVG